MLLINFSTKNDKTKEEQIDINMTNKDSFKNIDKIFEFELPNIVNIADSFLYKIKEDNDVIPIIKHTPTNEIMMKICNDEANEVMKLT